MKQGIGLESAPAFVRALQKIAIAGAAVLSLPAIALGAVRTTVVSDDFNRASLGSAWHQINPYWDEVYLSAASVFFGPTATGNRQAARWIGGTVGSDQFASVEIASLGYWSGDYAIGVIGRASADVDDARDYYAAEVQADSPGPTYTTQLVKVVNGVTTVLHSAEVEWQVGDRIELEIEGTQLRVLKNGTPLGGLFTATDTSLSSGSVGILASGNEGTIHGDNLVAGNLSPGGGGAGDTQAPTAPSGLGATVASSAQINLSWTASTDNVGVTAYRVERCQGSGCSNFAQIATPTGTTFSDTGLTGSTSYSYRVRAADAAGNLSAYSNTASATTQAPPDTQAPTAPTSLTATPVSSTQINLAWAASTDNVGVTGYRVERCQGAGCSNFAQIATPTSTTFSNTGLSASTSYSYRVRAVDAAGNLSPYTSTVSASTQAPPDTQAPTAPTNLTATPVSSSQINLTWAASTDNVGVTGYRVERCQGVGCSNFAQIAAPPATTFSDTGLIGSTSYSYRVRAVDAAGNLSAYSNTTSATTQAPPDTQAPTAPSGLAASPISSSQINLSWTASTDNVGVTGYRVERCQGSGCSNFAQIATPVGTAFSDSGLSPATSYTYRVRAVDAAGNFSVYSNPASATTQSLPDTQSPTAPSGLTANPAATLQINLSWSGSTDNVGVTGYRVERCQGAGCTNFAQIGTPAGTSYSDLSIAYSTTYRYRVRAADAAGNLSAYSNIASATTPMQSETITYIYDAKGRLIGVRRTGDINNNVQTDYTYDKANNRKSTTTTGSPNQ